MQVKTDDEDASNSLLVFLVEYYSTLLARDPVRASPVTGIYARRAALVPVVARGQQDQDIYVYI